MQGNPCDKQKMFRTLYTSIKRHLPHSFIDFPFPSHKGERGLSRGMNKKYLKQFKIREYP